MARLDAARLAAQRRRNWLVSAAVLAAIVGWMVLIAWLVLGEQAAVWALMAGPIVLAFPPVRSTAVLKALYGAVPLGPATAPGLLGLVRELAGRAELARIPPLLYIPRPEVVALSTGWGREAALAVSDGLLRLLPPRELAAVLAHEVAHLQAGDLKILRLADAAGRLTRLLSMVGLLLVAMTLPTATLAGLPIPWLAILLLMLAPVGSDLMALALSRTREFAADAGAAGLTGDPAALIHALERIDTVQSGGWERLVRLPGWRWVSWIRTHPTTGERVTRLSALAPEPERHWILLPHAILPPDFPPLGLNRWGWRR